MKKPKVIVLRASGINCDKETAFVFEQAGAEADLVHINKLKASRNMLLDYHVMVIPGGFSYGDDVSSGKILGNELKFSVGREISDFIKHGKLMLGICNGFQVLTKTGFLPGFKEDAGKPSPKQLVALMGNDSNRYEDRWVHLKAVSKKCVFTRGLDVVNLPVAHGEGKFMPMDKKTLDKLKKNGQIVFKYIAPDGKKAEYPGNPNGAVEDIAAICDHTGRVMGMMPHPERNCHPTNVPDWTKKGLKKMPDGMKIFVNAVEYAREKL